MGSEYRDGVKKGIEGYRDGVKKGQEFMCGNVTHARGMIPYTTRARSWPFAGVRQDWLECSASRHKAARHFQQCELMPKATSNYWTILDLNDRT